MLGGENMRTQNFSILGLLFVSLSMVGLPTSASTPAEETVCDPLMAEGTTPGLYGLCIAFCEAQDLASEDYPVTDEELAALQENAPSGNILDAYNNIKKADDPDMPCIVVDSSCPCWTEGELAAIDGMIPDANGFLDCEQQTNPDTGIVDVASTAEVEILNTDPPRQRLSILATATNTISPEEGNIQRCIYRNNQVSPTESRFLDVGQGTLTPGQAAACVEEVFAHCNPSPL
jgi:hypothetical protein